MKENLFELATDLELQTRVLEGIVWLQEEIGEESNEEKRLMLLDLLRFTLEKHLEEMNNIVKDSYEMHRKGSLIEEIDKELSK